MDVDLVVVRVRGRHGGRFDGHNAAFRAMAGLRSLGVTLVTLVTLGPPEARQGKLSKVVTFTRLENAKKGNTSFGFRILRLGCAKPRRYRSYLCYPAF
jgi:lipoate synthase